MIAAEEDRTGGQAETQTTAQTAAPSAAQPADEAGNGRIGGAEPPSEAQSKGGAGKEGAAAPAAEKSEAPAPEGKKVGETLGSVFGTLDFTPNFSALAQKRQSVELSWEKVVLEISGKRILHEVSGRVGANELCGLLGPSGAGKSSLLNILAGRVSSSKKKSVSGSMFVNGQATSPVAFRRNVAYVLQEDALFATATAREALEFSAQLRLPKAVSAEERASLVDELLRSLGLLHVQNTMVGSELVRGLSGGEKKRVSIGVELVTNPQLLFLDEPTSGLDSYSAFQVVSILKALSASGCAVLCTIHQPSSEIFSVFDKAIVLSSGRILYEGGVNTMPGNLARAGFPMPALTNPADFVMVLAQTKSGDELPHVIEGQDGHRAEVVDGKRESSSIVIPGGGAQFGEIRTSGFWTQLRLLSLREFRNLRRDKAALVARFGISLFLNLLFGWIFFRSADVDAENYTLTTHFGALVNAYISALFGAAQPPLLTFPLERVVFLREYSTGTYSSAPYFFSKLMVELPLYLVTAIFILVILYWLIGFVGNFGALFVELFLLQIVSASYAYLLGALVSDIKQAQELSPIVFVPQLLFAGFFIRIEQIPESIRWVQYLCSLKYGLNLAMLTEFGGERCRGDSPGGDERVFACQQLLESSDVDEDLVWLYVVIMLVIFVGFRSGSLATLVWRARNFSS